MANTFFFLLKNPRLTPNSLNPLLSSKLIFPQKSILEEEYTEFGGRTLGLVMKILDFPFHNQMRPIFAD